MKYTKNESNLSWKNISHRIEWIIALLQIPCTKWFPYMCIEKSLFLDMVLDFDYNLLSNNLKQAKSACILKTNSLNAHFKSFFQNRFNILRLPSTYSESLLNHHLYANYSNIYYTYIITWVWKLLDFQLLHKQHLRSFLSAQPLSFRVNWLHLRLLIW